MYYYHIAFPTPCKDCKESDNFSSDLFTKLWKQLTLQLSESCNDEYFNFSSLPVPLWGASKNLFQLLPVLHLSSNKEIPEWFNLAKFMHHDLFLETLLKEFENVNWNELDYAEIIAEQLHNIADSTTDKLYFLNIYWLTCGHAQCIESSDNTAIHGALIRLQKWNMASVTFICNSDILREEDFTHSWFQIQHIYVVSQDQKMLLDNNVIWQGSLECLQNDENDDDWRLSRMMCKSVQSSEASLSYSEKDGIPAHTKDNQVLADNVKVICELPKSAVPFWKIFPSQFVLYHKSLLKQVVELRETEGLVHEGLKDTLLLASIATYDRKHQNQARTTQDWMEFIASDTSDNDKMQIKFPVIETHYLVLYPLEPGIFITSFIRLEDSFTNLYSSLAVYRAIFPCTEKEKTTMLYEDTLERRWLQLLDAIQSSQKSPLKSQFSLAVHLDASEMLKHFTKDGKPMKKELKSLLKQIEEKRKISPSKQTEIEKRQEVVAGVQYCLDKMLTQLPVSSSAKLLPKHETLSICNTPKTLGKAKLQDVKRKTLKTETTELADGMNEQVVSTDTLGQSRKKSRPENPETSNKQRNKEMEGKRDPSAEGTSKKKRRSFDGNETIKETATKEKRSDRHKRRLARVVKRTLIKYGVDPSEEYFTTCSERLYYLCKSFLKDLKTSEGLNNEMKRLADSNVATVVEFEKRQHVSKQSEKQQSEKQQSNTTTNS